MKDCEHCGEPFARNPKESAGQWNRRRFCGRGCAVRWQVIHKPKPRATGDCLDCGQWTDKLIKARCQSCYDKLRYKEQGERIRENNRRWREANPEFWKQPHRVEANRQRATSAYHGDYRLREAVLARDSSTCQACGRHEQLHAHHIDGDRENRVLENLIVLCGPCHARLHRQADLSDTPIHRALDELLASKRQPTLAT